jgi:hypothetical protein
VHYRIALAKAILVFEHVIQHACKFGAWILIFFGGGEGARHWDCIAYLISAVIIFHRHENTDMKIHILEEGMGGRFGP